MKFRYAIDRLMEIKEDQLELERGRVWRDDDRNVLLSQILKELKALNYLTDLKGGEKNGKRKNKI